MGSTYPIGAVQRKNYKRIRVNRKKTRDEHRIVMERHLGRKLTRDEFVHHKNEDKRDNRIENLEIMSRSDHARMHALSSGITPPCPSEESRKKIRAAMTGENGRSAKLKESQVREIKSLLRAGEKGRALAFKFNISHSVISDIKNGKLWVGVE